MGSAFILSNKYLSGLDKTINNSYRMLYPSFPILCPSFPILYLSFFINLESLAALLFNPPRHYKTDFILFSICQKPSDACFDLDI
jgi:hypothetical protein